MAKSSFPYWSYEGKGESCKRDYLEIKIVYFLYIFLYIIFNINCCGQKKRWMKLAPDLIQLAKVLANLHGWSWVI